MTARGVEAELDKRLPAVGADAKGRLAAAMRHAVLAGGKRIRPFLVVQSAALFDTPAHRATVLAAALECVHCYSLVHDDLPAMDDDALRRGKPTVHVAFDEATAILTGDALLTLAFEIAASPDMHPDAGVRIAITQRLAECAGVAGMVGGQMLDLAAEEGGFDDADAVRTIQALKTGALIGFACEAGALLGGAEDRLKQALVRYADHLGLAFQIADDLLDVEGTAATVGKATGKDAQAGKATFVSLFGVDGARDRLAKETEAAIAALDPFGTAADPLCAAARYVMTRDV